MVVELFLGIGDMCVSRLVTLLCRGTTKVVVSMFMSMSASMVMVAVGVKRVWVGRMVLRVLLHSLRKDIVL